MSRVWASAPRSWSRIEAKVDEDGRPAVFIDGRKLSTHATLTAARLVARQHQQP